MLKQLIMTETTAVIFQGSNNFANNIYVYMLPVKLFDGKVKTLFPYTFTKKFL